jgi:putative membrane protein
MKHVLYFLVMSWSFVTISRVLPGFHVRDWGAALIAALVLGAANTVLKPVLLVLTLPLTILTVGFFLLVLNALMLWITDLLVPGFSVHGFLPLFFGSLLLAVVGMVWKSIAKED